MRLLIAVVMMAALPAWAQDAQRAAATGHRFTLEDLDDIAEYLNRTHYRLQK